MPLALNQEQSIGGTIFKDRPHLVEIRFIHESQTLTHIAHLFNANLGWATHMFIDKLGCIRLSTHEAPWFLVLQNIGLSPNVAKDREAPIPPRDVDDQ